MLHRCFLIDDNLLVLIIASSMMLSDRINSMLLYTTTVNYLITLKEAACITGTLLCESGPVQDIT
jgi:hypothetical protein